MRKKLLIFFGIFVFCVSMLLIFKVPQRFFATNRQSETVSPCKYQKEQEEVFSTKHYFSKEDATQLFGKQVRNLKCGKIKCPVRSNDCMNVEIGELGKVVSLKPRQGFSDYTIIVEWDEPKKEQDTFAEQGLNKFVSYLGNDGSYQVLE